MGILELFAAISVTKPSRSILSRDKVLRISAAGRKPPNKLAAHLRKHGVKVYHHYMHPDNTIRFKVDDVKKARRLLK